LDPARRRELIAELIEEIEAEAAAARKRDGVQVAGADAVLAHHPHDRPEKLKKGPAPLFHAATAEMRAIPLESLRRVRRPVPRRCGEASGGESRGRLSAGLLPTGPTVRAWVKRFPDPA
jgi:hypothetical protein